MDVEFITNLILYHSSLFLNIIFDSKLLQSFRRKIALSRIQLNATNLNDKHELDKKQMVNEILRVYRLKPLPIKMIIYIF